MLGCDSVFEFDGLAYGKPYTAEVARERISQMSGNAGVLHTGHWLVDTRDPDDGGSGATVGAVASAERAVRGHDAGGDRGLCRYR